MCEVEFWEVFNVMCKGFLNGCLRPFVDCQLANLCAFLCLDRKSFLVSLID